MKLVLGILHLLNDPHPLEHAHHLSEEEWRHLEKEQRQLYSELVAENNQTLQSLGSFTVKTEAVPPTEIEAVTVALAEVSSGTTTISNGNTYTDSQTDTPRSPLPDSYQNPFVDILKASNLSVVCAPSSHSQSTTGSFLADSTLTTFTRTFSETEKGPCMIPEEPGISHNLPGSSFTDSHLAGSSDDFQENLANLKQEMSPSDLQLPSCAVETNLDNQNVQQKSPSSLLKKPRTAGRMRYPEQSQAARTLLVTSESNKTACDQYKTQSATSTRKKPFQCQRCEKSFNCSSHLIMHQHVHTREKPYVCECGKSFTQSSSLFRHQRAHRGERPHVCTECGKSFAQTSEFLIHKRIHTGEKPYLCADCGKSFLASASLVRHQRVHIGKKKCTAQVQSSHLHIYRKSSAEQNLPSHLVLSSTS
ncbi:uncharacterized protein [Pyxicephalus adspersus]